MENQRNPDSSPTFRDTDPRSSHLRFSVLNVTEREHSTWFKILNREYSQKEGREDLFERDRRSEPGPGWHSCVVACCGSIRASRP
jgi:hypothetical protein